MQIFLCWSGDRGLKLALVLKDFLANGLPQLDLPKIDCFLSASGINKGEFWFERIRQELAASDGGLICLTPENVDSRWMHFEAGSLLGAKEPKRIYTYSLGESPDDVKDPFKSLQITVSTEDDTRQLIAALLGQKIETIEEAKFKKCWQTYGKRIEELRTPHIPDLIPGFDRLFQRKTFEERLEECPDQAWLDRFLGIQETLWKLRDSNALIERLCQPYQIWLYHRLLAQIDGYSREIRDFLLGERKFKLHDSGQKAGNVKFEEGGQFADVSVPSNLSVAIERRCRNIRGLSFLLTWPPSAPVHKEALAFERLQPSEFLERKILIRSAQIASVEDRCRRSYWQYDRIVFYLSRGTSADLTEQCEWVREEVERARAADSAGSAMPLHYAVRSLAAALRKQNPAGDVLEEIRRAVEEARAYLGKSERSEPPVTANLDRIESLVQDLTPRAGDQGVTR
jgi:hypothetical protein